MITCQICLFSITCICRLGKIPLPGCPALPGRGAGQRQKKVALPGELPGLKEEILSFLVLQTRPRYHFQFSNSSILNFFSVLRCSRISQHTTFLLSFIGYKTNHLYFISHYHISFKINIPKTRIYSQPVYYVCIINRNIFIEGKILVDILNLLHEL